VFRETKQPAKIESQMVPWKRIVDFYTLLLNASVQFEAFMEHNRWFPTEDDFEADLRIRNKFQITVKQELQYITDGIARRPPGRSHADDDHIMERLKMIDRRLGQMGSDFGWFANPTL
jgi:hypothetical protein